MPRENFFDVRRRRQSQIVARLAMRLVSIIRPADYGAAHVSAALDRVVVLSAVEKCESENALCSASRIRKDTRMPDKTVRRALDDLVTAGMLTRNGRFYATREDTEDLKTDAVVNAVMMAARELTELDGHQLVVGNGNSKKARRDQPD